jgi:hypothetical protein
MRLSYYMTLSLVAFAQVAEAAPVAFGRTNSVWLVERDDQQQQCTMTTRAGNSLVSFISVRSGGTALLVTNEQWQRIEHGDVYPFNFQLQRKWQLNMKGYNQNGRRGIGLALSEPVMSELRAAKRMVASYGATTVLDLPLLEMGEGERLLRQCTQQLN